MQAPAALPPQPDAPAVPPSPAELCPPDASAAGPFHAFFAHASSAGLSVVTQYDPAALLRYAEQALVLEQKLATGCFLLQGVLLVEYCMRTAAAGVSELDLQRRAQAFAQGFYLQRCGPEGRSLSVRQQEDVSWRARFAVQVHAVMLTPEFVKLQPLLIQTCISTLRALHRAWHPRHLTFFIRLLEYVDAEHLGYAIVTASIRAWTRETVESALEGGEAERLFDEFRQAAQSVRTQRADRRQLLKHPQLLLSSPPPTPSSSSSVHSHAFPSMLQGCVQQLVQQPEALLSVDMPLETVVTLESQASPPTDSASAPAVSLSSQPSTQQSAALDALFALSQPGYARAAHPNSAHAQSEPPVEPAAATARSQDPRRSAPADAGRALTVLAATSQARRRLRSQSPSLHEAKPAESDPDSDSDEDATGSDDALAAEAAAAAAVVTKSSSTAKPSRASRVQNATSGRGAKKRRRSAPAAPAPPSSDAAAEVVCLPAMPSVPLKLLRLGVSAWRSIRSNDSRQSRADRDALDDALAALVWDLERQLSNGRLLTVPGYQQARRSEERKASAVYSGVMSGDRQCQRVLDLLHALEQEMASAVE